MMTRTHTDIGQFNTVCYFSCFLPSYVKPRYLLLLHLCFPATFAILIYVEQGKCVKRQVVGYARLELV